ncbi:MAG TPA: phosphonopyruvate decarboxylase [Burkholderiales bacterium]
MIEPAEFALQAAALGYRWYAGLPCSFFTGLINHVNTDPALTYVSSANEGDAVAAAAGAWVGGRRSIALMQNSGLGNAVSPLTSLTHVFRIPVLLLVTVRGEPGVADEPQHALMGRITPALLDIMEIPWAYLPDSPQALAQALAQADASIGERERPYALLVRKGRFAPCKPAPVEAPPRSPRAAPRSAWRSPPAVRPSRIEALERVARLVPKRNNVVIATTGYTGRELYALGDHAHQLYMVGSMGCASSFGLGLALTRPDLRVVVLDGDGAALMRMGNLATIGAYRPRNLLHVLLDNEVHDSTGGQATVARDISFAAIAAACGYAEVSEGDNLSLLDEALQGRNGIGPVFVHLKIAPGVAATPPRPGLAPADVLRRLMNHIGSPSLSAHPCAKTS